MTDGAKPASTARKIASVALLVLGTLCLYTIALGTTAAGLRPGKNGATFWALTVIGVAICLGLIWGGAELWNRWRMLLGVCALVLGGFTTRGVTRFRGWAAEKTGEEATWLAHTASVFVVYAVLLALAGVALILWDLRRKPPSVPSSGPPL